MTAATKTKKTKIQTIYPPMEIREITKARRAWLAEKLAYINSGGFATTTGAKWEGKIVGNGSYQSISVYEITEVAGRLRHRGHCQFCGNSQVVDESGVMVLHGYTRPGDGYIFNECPCVGSRPLETSQTLTEDYLKSARETLAMIEKKLAKAEAAHRAASNAKWAGNREVEANAYLEKPHGLRRTATAEEVKAYGVEMEKWAAKFPLTAKYVETERREAELKNSVWAAKRQVTHFETLLGWKLLGKPLIEEVVV